jgi:hypothetical protein
MLFLFRNELIGMVFFIEMYNRQMGRTLKAEEFVESIEEISKDAARYTLGDLRQLWGDCMTLQVDKQLFPFTVNRLEQASGLISKWIQEKIRMAASPVYVFLVYVT